MPRFPILEIEDEAAFVAYNPIRQRNFFFLMWLVHVKKLPYNRWLANYLEAEDIEVVPDDVVLPSTPASRLGESPVSLGSSTRKA